MRMRGNDIAACLVIALGVGGVLAGSLLGGPSFTTLPAVDPQPVSVDVPMPTAEPEPTPEPTPTV